MNIIKSIKFRNFYNFIDEQTINFSLNKRASSSDFDINLKHGVRVSSILCVLGHNGAGKTNALKALAFLQWFLNSSYKLEPDEKILFHSYANSDAPTNFEVNYFDNGLEYKYELELTQKKVIQEVLSVKSPETGKFTFIVKRNNKDKDTIALKIKSPGSKSAKTKLLNSNGNNFSIFSFFTHISEDLKEISDRFRTFAKVETNINYIGKSNVSPQMLFKACEWYSENEEVFNKAKAFLINADLGIKDITLNDIEYIDANDETQTRTSAYCLHDSPVGSFELPLLNESTGTKSLFVYLTHIYIALQEGSIAVVDELDNDLHLHMLKPLIELFADERSNPNSAQLLFSCHSPDILNHLSKHQVYLIEKENSVSDCWRLDEVEGLRADDNLFQKYVNGSLGGIGNF